MLNPIRRRKLLALCDPGASIESEENAKEGRDSKLVVES